MNLRPPSATHTDTLFPSTTLFRSEPDVWASVGSHPHDADAHAYMDTARLVDAADHPRVVAIGETGLDYYYDHSDRTRQQMSFRAHIAAARETRSEEHTSELSH